MGPGVEQCRHVVNPLPEDSIILQFSRFIACPNILHVCKSSIGHLSTGLKSQPQIGQTVFSEFTALTSGNTFIQLHGHDLNPAVHYPAVDILPILVSCRTILSKH